MDHLIHYEVEADQFIEAANMGLNVIFIVDGRLGLGLQSWAKVDYDVVPVGRASSPSQHIEKSHDY